MCFTGEVVARITEEVERHVEPTNRCGVFVDRLLEVKQKCPQCQEKKAEDDATAWRKLKLVENTLYKQHTRNLSDQKELAPSVHSLKSPSPPRRSEIERFSPYHSLVRPLSITKNGIANNPQRTNAYQDPRIMPLSSPAPSPEMSRPSLQTYSKSTATSPCPMSDPDSKLESFNKWFQRIDNPVDPSLRVTPPP